MKNTIYKYPITGGDTVQIPMPLGAQIISVAYQESTNQLCLWAIVDAQETIKEKRIIEIFGTGQVIPDNMEHRKFIGTVLCGLLVYHIFEWIFI